MQAVYPAETQRLLKACSHSTCSLQCCSLQWCDSSRGEGSVYRVLQTVPEQRAASSALGKRRMLG